MNLRGSRARAVPGLTITLGLCLLAAAIPASAVPVTGTVVDRAGKPIEYASISVAALKAGAVSDEQGHFALDLPPGLAQIEFSQIGYQRARLAIEVIASLPPLRVTLADQPVPVAEVTVAASSFGKTGKSEGATLRRMQVMLTPGGAADVFQSLRAMPGSNAPTEGAAVYVRGGDPHETLIRLDGGEFGHPYHYEASSGGLFSQLDPYMLKSAFFSSGGFSAKYGGVLSGVLDIETQDPMNLKTLSVGANIVGGGASTSWALVPDKLSFVGTLRLAEPELLYKLYGSTRDFESAPRSRDAAGKLLYRYSPSGRLSLTALHSGEDFAVHANRLNFEGVYAEHAHSEIAALNLSDVVAGRIALRGQASGQRYQSGYTFGGFGSARGEDNGQANLDAVWPISAGHELSFGGNLRYGRTAITGHQPADSSDLGSGAPGRDYDTRITQDSPGFYLEDKLRLIGPIYATLGGRLDWASTTRTWTADPRAAVAWRVDEQQTVRVAAGRYHQLPDASGLDPRFGNPRLAPLAAEHFIAGYEWKSEFGNVRLEAYRKVYHDLVAQSAATFFDNHGFGYARGVDAFVQGTWRTLSGWASYGYLDSKRLELDDSHEVRSAYGVRHSLTLVSQYQWNSRWMFGARYGCSTGRPYTPVIGRSYDPVRAIWRPTFGDHHSAELPAYGRADLRIMRLFSLPAGAGLPPSSVCVAYLEALNVLGTRNLLDYVWNSDYSRRYETDSYFGRRFLVAGFQLTW